MPEKREKEHVLLSLSDCSHRPAEQNPHIFGILLFGGACLRARSFWHNVTKFVSRL